MDKMAYAVGTGEKMPWNAGAGYTTALEGHVDAARMVAAAGLAWSVEKAPVFDRTGAAIPKTYALHRSDTGSVLGIAGEAYTPVQNITLLEIGEAFLQDGRVSWSTGGCIDGGARVFASYKMGDDWRIGDDYHAAYMFLHAGHDGKTGITYKLTDVRAVCDNTVAMALASRETPMIQFVKHSRVVDDRLARVAAVMAISTEQQRRMAEFLTRALDTEINTTVLDNTIEAIFGEAPEDDKALDRYNTKIRKFTNKFWLPEFDRTGATAYTLFNTITGYADHGLTYYGSEAVRDERRFAANVLDGNSEAARVKKVGMNIVSELVGA